MQDELKAFLSHLQSLFLAGDSKSLLTYFELPLVVYTAAGVTVLRNETEFERLAQDYMTALRERQVSDGRQTILSRDSVVNNRQRVTVRTIDLSGSGRPVTSSTVRYFLVLNERSYSVEMLEYIEAPLPISDVEKIIH